MAISARCARRDFHSEKAGTIQPFPLRIDNGEEKAGSANVVERRCENLKSSGEGEGVRTSGGEETESYSERGSAEGDGVGYQV